MPTLASPKGTRDFYPEDMALREFIFASWDRTCRRYAFEKYDAPLFEHLDLYTKKSGDEIEKQLYAFQDKAGRNLALRPEMTPSLARMVAARGNSLKRPVRWYSIPRLFRYEKMQRGRLREFFQLNMDILGVAESTADADLVAAVVGMMTDLGLDSGDFSVHLSSRDLLEQLLGALGVPEDKVVEVFQVLDKRHKVESAAFDDMLTKCLGERGLALKVVDSLGASSLEEVESRAPGLPAVAQLRELLGLLTGAYGIGEYLRFDMGIVRGLAYYTGTVFEVFDRKRTMRAIAGGGRYDRLVASYGGPQTPAVGFAAGDVVLADLLAEKGIVPPSQPRSSAFVVSVTGETAPAIAAAQTLRNAGVSSEYSLKPASVGKQLKHANSAGSPLVVFVGGNEEVQGKLRVKDMRTGEESLLPVDSAASEIKSRLG